MKHLGTLESATHLTVFSLGQAAKEVGKSKTTISRAINSGKISANGNSENGYQIQPCELFRVFKRVTPVQPSHSDEVDVPLPHVTRGETLMLQAQLEAKTRECGILEERIIEAKELLEDTRSERDKWASGFANEQAKSTQYRLDYQQEKESNLAVKAEPKRSTFTPWILALIVLALGAILADRFGLISLLDIVTL